MIQAKDLSIIGASEGGILIQNDTPLVIDGGLFADNNGPDIESSGPVTIKDCDFIEKTTPKQATEIKRGSRVGWSPNYRLPGT